MTTATPRLTALAVLLLLGSATILSGEETHRFVEVASQVGLTYKGPVFAAAATDYDRDGWIDLAVSNHGQLRLFRNLQGEGFAEPHGSVLGAPGDTHGVSFVDLDDDGWLDLYVSLGAARGHGRGSNRFYSNRNGRAFVSESDLSEALADPLGRGRCSVPWDVDGDGRLELLVLNYMDEGRPHRLLERTGKGWQDVAARHGLDQVQAECMTVLAVGGVPTYVAYGSGRDSGHFFRSDATGRLADVSEELGVQPEGVVFAVATGDYDNDLDTDLYLVRGHGIPPTATVSQGVLEFRLVRDDPRARPLVRFAAEGDLTLDFDLGGRQDPARIRYGRAGERPRELPWHVNALDPGLEGRPSIDSVDGTELQVSRGRDGIITIELVGEDPRFRAASGRIRSNKAVRLLEGPAISPRPQPNLLLENRQGRFVDVTQEAGVGNPLSGRDAVFFDMDNDFDLDLYVVNGGTAFSNQANALYRNNGSRAFTDITTRSGVAGSEAGRGSTVTAFDFDNDGDLDLFLTNGDGPAFGNRGPYSLLRNESRASASAQVQLIGREGNRLAIGTRLRLTVGDEVRESQLVATTSRFSSSVLPVHIGLAGAAAAKVEILWPGGEPQQVRVEAKERRTLPQRDRD